MPFLDFLSQPMGGYAGGSPGMQGPTPTGQPLGSPQGLSYGDLMKTALAASSSPSAKNIGSLVPGTSVQQQGMNALTSSTTPVTPPAQSPSTSPQPLDAAQKQDQWMKNGTGNQLMGLITQFFGSMLGIPGV
jgi:hypothetical protein